MLQVPREAPRLQEGPRRLKTCPRCGEDKPADAEHFVFQRGKPSRLCRACTNVSSRESHRRRREARARGEQLAPKPKPAKPTKKPKPPAKPNPVKLEPPSEPTTGRAKDCRYTGRCKCDTHLPVGYWRRLERNARRFAEELERLDETDPAEARRRETELLARPPGMSSGTLR